MKKTLFILSLLVILTGFAAGANDDVALLRQETEAAARQCPINMGMMGEITDINYVEKAKEVQIFCSVNSSLIDLNVLRENRQATINNVKLTMSSDESKALVRMMIKAGAALAFTYRNNMDNQSLTVTLSVNDLKDILYNPMTDEDKYRMILGNQIAIETARCPYSVAPGMEMTRVVDEGDKLVYECSVDESIYNMSAIRSAVPQMKQNMYSIFSDPTVKAQLVMLSTLGMGMVYRYYGSSTGETTEVVFTPAEIIRHLAQ